MAALPELVRSEYRDGVTWLTLNRPSDANALDVPLARQFRDAVAAAAREPECAVLVLQGEGQFFCAGGDVAAMASADDARALVRELAGTMHESLLALAHSNLVTIAAVGGPAVGGGLGIVLNSDLVIASERALFLSGYGGIGVTPDCGVSFLLPRVVGPRRAAELTLAGRSVDATLAFEWGLVNEVVKSDALASRVAELAASIADGARQALGPTKRMLAGDLAQYAAHLDAEADSIAALVAHPDSARRIAAFAERSRARQR